MQDDAENELRLERSWRANASAWSDAVREQRIASRRAGTDAAIVAAVVEAGARRVLDFGCGEGWLARELAARGIDVIGVDASPELIEAACELGGARFEIASYADLATEIDAFGTFDAAVFNFALLGEDLATPLRAARAMLRSSGHLLIQTVHPWTACGDAPYADGWRIETFAAFGSDFREPMPWHFRTLESWIAAIRASGFAIERIREPAAGQPLSLLIEAALHS